MYREESLEELRVGRESRDEPPAERGPAFSEEKSADQPDWEAAQTTVRSAIDSQVSFNQRFSESVRLMESGGQPLAGDGVDVSRGVADERYAVGCHPPRELLER